MIFNQLRSIKAIYSIATCIALLLQTSVAFVIHSKSIRSSNACISTTSGISHLTASTPSSSSGLRMAVEEDTLDQLTNHEEEGSRLAVSIAGWLDEEWMPQEVHVKMGESAKRSFVSARESGENTIAPIMMKVAGDLEDNWAEYDADAFVNAWDIGNYVADYLMDRVGNEGCGCSAKIYKDEAQSTFE
mmetsp:Transcript_34759/g.41578  ORF Transcript_34759/g.41578 Transcript_34759/m.41578 type:complete len:188 (-) Transcript_34759:405-968(-)